LQSRIFNIGWKLIDMIFPPSCAGCGKWGERYCQTCFANTRTISPEICQTCGEPLRQNKVSICERCKSSEIYFTAVRSWALYEDPLKKAIHNLKYQRNIGLGEVLSVPLAKFLIGTDWNIDLITAVPLDRDRKQERGYNQSVFLARPLSWLTKIPFNEKTIVRVRKTRPQVGLSREQRKQNMDGAFCCQSDIAYGKSILIIDDVITTGSTLNACSKALIESGAEHVFGLTLARSARL